MSEVKWLLEALDDIERLYRFLESKNEQAAMSAAQTILDGAEMIEASPRIGRPMPDETKRRELFVSFASGGYVLRYMLEGEETAVIIRVWHSKEER